MLATIPETVKMPTEDKRQQEKGHLQKKGRQQQHEGMLEITETPATAGTPVVAVMPEAAGTQRH